MTRFARAKGSKASNERVPEEATPWDEMKQQLLQKDKEQEENKKRKDVIEARNANYKAFLEEKERDNERNASWAEFPDASQSTVKEKNNKKEKILSEGSPAEDNDDTPKQDAVIITNENIFNGRESDSDEPPDEASSKTETPAPIVTKKKKIKPKKPLKIPVDQVKKTNDNIVHQGKKRKPSNDEESIRKKSKKENNTDPLKSKQNPDKQKKKIVKENLTEKDLKKIEKKKQKRIKQLEKKKRVKAELKQEVKAIEEAMKTKEHDETDTTKVQTEIQNPLKSFEKSSSKSNYPKNPNNGTKFTEKQKNKVKDNEEHARKKPLLPHKMFINGKELEIEYIDGFPVKKEDALRLKKLRREMISKGLPRSEINIALKLERRKAEKAFAREKKKVCFHCRKSGHNLSECPDFDKNNVAQTAPSGICFKCGSTEHTHFECKVVRGQEFKYATCFVCKEQGHIARQCPDNARGLYPKGGACKVCGDVTHLKKDCPKYQAQQQKQEENLRIESLGNSNPDILEETVDDKGGLVQSKRSNKIIKF